MATQDEIIEEIYKAVSTGAGVALTEEEKSDLHNWYYNWIAKKKTDVSTSPQEIWDTKDGEKLKKRFEKIGREMAYQKKNEKKTSHLLVAVQTVERLSDCPHCPDPPTG